MAEPESVVREAIVENTLEEIYNSEYEDFQKLKQAAMTYIRQVQEISNLYEQIISKSKLQDKIREIYVRMREETSFTRLMLDYQHTFETSLNDFLGRKIYLTYVNDDGTFYYYDDLNIGKLYQTATANKGRGNISESSIFDANDLEENLQKELKKAADERKKVYTTALERYRKNKVEESMDYNPSKNTYYWWTIYHRTLRHTDKIVNEGPIAEGYADSVVQQDPNISNNNIEMSLEHLWLNYIHKDSIGAIEKGDVVLKGTNLEFAIKKGSFSTAMVRQYIQLAYNISQIDMITKEELKANINQLSKLSKAAVQLVENLRQKTEDEIENFLLDKR